MSQESEYLFYKGLFRYLPIGYNALYNAKMCTIDAIIDEEDEVEDITTKNNPFSILNTNIPSTLSNNMLTTSKIQTMTMKIVEYQLNGDNVKTIELKNINTLIEEIINFYYDNSFVNKNSDQYENYKHLLNIDSLPSLQNDIGQYTRRFISKINMLSSIMYSEGRFGPVNLCIVSQDVYDMLSVPYGNNAGIRYIVNPTNLHNDKAILIRLSDQKIDPGVTVFTDTDINNDRFLKLEKIMKNLNKDVKERTLSYNIMGVGNAYKYTVGILYT